jgi:hypothetical protein
MKTAENRLRSMVISAAMAALAIVLPMVFHATGLGSHFLPMLLPLLHNAFLSSTGWAVFTAAIVPWLSAFATGMPPVYPPMALVMSVEALLMAAVTNTVHRCNRKLVWPALLAGIAADRMASFVLTLLLSAQFGLPAKVVAISVFVRGLPGVALQLAVIPLVLKGIGERRSILFDRND